MIMTSVNNNLLFLLIQFLENCLNIACQFLLPPVHFQVRVGALYLLYGLYNTQPCVPKVKVRIVHTVTMTTVILAAAESQ